MFKLTRPCITCPFRVQCGKNFALGEERIREIVEAIAFQCHKTVDYDGEEDEDGFVVPSSGDKPEQCAGLMGLLHRVNRPNQIMQVGERLGAFDPSKLELNDVYATIEDAIRDHADRVNRRVR